MRVLVDYDNLPQPMKAQGMITLADRVFELVRGYLTSREHLDMKFYGGWFNEEKLTNLAQQLHVALAASFPYPLWIKDNTGARLVTVTATLAYSLEALPKKSLYHTYRMRPPARRMTCEHPSDHGCESATCPLRPIVSFVNTGRCQTHDCSAKPRELFRAAGGQKLVDTMVVADLVHLSKIEPSIAVVCSDDDFWPGMISALVEGAHLIHIQSGSATSGVPYWEGVPGRYTSFAL